MRDIREVRRPVVIAQRSEAVAVMWGRRAATRLVELATAIDGLLNEPVPQRPAHAAARWESPEMGQAGHHAGLRRASSAQLDQVRFRRAAPDRGNIR